MFFFSRIQTFNIVEGAFARLKNGYSLIIFHILINFFFHLGTILQYFSGNF